MVMAGTAPGPATDISLPARLQWLQQRKEQLQEKLALKNSELKNLCIDEAELTGVLPPEIPLEPGESPPAFRKRAGTCFAYPQNIINRLKTNEAEESTLELERQVQVNTAETSFRILNDPTESKTVRRKHRSIYQQSQRRLRDLDARLSFIRQAYGRIQRISNPAALDLTAHTSVDGVQANAKHRTKKPRPPLDSLGYDPVAKTFSSRNILQESGVNLSPSSGADHQHQNLVYRQNAWSPRAHRAGIEDESGTLSSDIRNFNHAVISPTIDPLTGRQRRSTKYPEHDLNDNHDVYILPDRYRPRTYSQGNGAQLSVPKYCQDTEKTYRTIPNTYTEEERQIRYRQMQQRRLAEQQNAPHQHIPQMHQKPPLHQNYPSNYHPQPYIENPSTAPIYQSEEFANRSVNRYGQTEVQRKNPVQQRTRVNRLSKTNMQENTRADGQLAAGYWIRENDDIVWCSEEPGDVFGSLDRRKYNAPLLQMKERGEEHYQQRNSSSGNRDYVLGLAGPSKHSSSSLTSQNYNLQVTGGSKNSYERISPTPPRTLLRTQSLGSVETWQNALPAENQPRDGVREDCTARRGKEKEWYETSMDSGYSVANPYENPHRDVPRQIEVGPRQIVPSPPPPPPPPLPTPPLPSSNLREVAQSPVQRRYQTGLRHQSSPKSLEIPAESKPNPERRRNLDDAMSSELSPDICTIVQAGKYQPYREVTKPFEMSDFYKYSTKYRKRTEQAAVQSPNASDENDIANTRRLDAGGIIKEDENTLPMQRRTYEPVQRMTCQPFANIGRRTAIENEEEWRSTSNNRTATEDSTVV